MTSEQGADRERRRVWAVSDYLQPVEADAFSCAPTDPDYWWVPDVGYSLPKTKLYDSEAAAVESALHTCGEKIAEYQHIEDRLLAQRARLRSMDSHADNVKDQG